MTVRDTLRPVMAAFMAIDLVVVVARLAVRLRLTKLGYDDFCIIFAMTGFILMCSFCYAALAYGFGVSDQAEIDAMPGYNAIAAAKWFTVAQITYVSSFGIVRVSVALVLLRIVNGGVHWAHRLLVSSIVVIMIYIIACMLVDALQCIPLKAVWGDGEGKCISFKTLAGLGFAVSALDIASALFYAVLPIFLLKGLQIGRRTKAAIMFLLGLGAVTVVISIVRLRSLVLIVHSTDTATTLTLELESFIYSVLEFGVSILTASLVALRPLIKYLPFGSRGHSSGHNGHSDGPASGMMRSGNNDFEMVGRRNIHNQSYADAVLLDSNDSESQRDILRDADGHGVWKHSKVTVTYEKQKPTPKEYIK